MRQYQDAPADDDGFLVKELFEVFEGVVDLNGSASQRDGSVHANGLAPSAAVAKAVVKSPCWFVALGAN